jgi:uncharacterized protein YyaL (SSP411 family)
LRLEERKPVTTHTHTNRLAGETSPYLLQHAHNPVDWYPWGPEALEKARTSDQPIFLSVGYSACHWCHVMEAESFESEDVARLLNEHFVSIKVDREERPDLDEVYMLATQLMSGSGGWPMSVFLTPDLKPFYAGTYFPPDDRYGRPGFQNLLRQLADYWHNRRDDVQQAANRAALALAQYASLQSEGGEITPDLIPSAVQAMTRDFDAVHGGFGGAPKFPPSMRLTLMLREHRRSPDPQLLNVVTTTLDRMARGGIYDQVGGGFHRYSVDQHWLVPHFEKMLYDNALLAPVYLDSFQTTGNAYHARIGREVLDYVLREMTDERGGFYSTLDADSEGHEGKFYLWSPEEVEAVLGPEDGALFCRIYDVTPGGNFEGKNIPNLIERSVEEQAAEMGTDPPALWARLDPLRERLREARAQRVWPGLDDKVLTAWNGLMIRAFAAGYRVLGDDRYRAAAVRAADFVLSTLQQDGRLLRTYRNGEARLNGYLEDYAFMTVALLDLHEAGELRFGAGGDSSGGRAPGNDLRWQAEAERLLEMMNEQFWDERGGGYFFTSHGHEALIARMKSNEDGAIPSGNSMAALALVRLARLTGRSDYREKAGRLLSSYAEMMGRAPAAFANMLLAADLYLEGAVGQASGVREEATAIPLLTPNADIAISASAAVGERVVRVEVRLEIPEGWHLNSHRPVQEYLKPTTLRLEPGVPYRLLHVDYPEGDTVTFPFDPEPLSVYQGTVTVTAEVDIPPSLGAGETSLPFLVSYQPCTDQECLPPVEKRLEVPLSAPH